MRYANKAWRRTGQLAAGLLIFASVAVLLLVAPLDHTPFLQSAYFSETHSRLTNQAEAMRVITGPLEAGFGKVLLSPVLGAAQEDPTNGMFQSLPLAGYGDRKGRPAMGTRDELYAKAVAVKVAGSVAVLVSADLLIIPREIADLVAQRAKIELQVEREQIYFGATHTHAGLGGWGDGLVAEAFAGEFQPGVRTWITECLVKAMRAALATLQPASFSEVTFEEPSRVRNRVVGSLGEVDTDFAVLQFELADGVTAVVGSYAAHATVLSSGNMEFSGDYPGAWQRKIEERPETMALFFAGSVGSHSPVAGGNTFEHAEDMGASLAEATLTRLAITPGTNVVTFGRFGLAAALPELHVRLTERLRLRPWVARRLLPVPQSTFLQVLRINRALWISTPCDYSGELARDTKAVLARAGMHANITSFNGDYVGYVIPARYYHLGGYEPRVMSFFGPTMPDYLDHLIRRMGGCLAQAPEKTVSQ